MSNAQWLKKNKQQIKNKAALLLYFPIPLYLLSMFSKGAFRSLDTMQCNAIWSDLEFNSIPIMYLVANEYKIEYSWNLQVEKIAQIPFSKFQPQSFTSKHPLSLGFHSFPPNQTKHMSHDRIHFLVDNNTNKSLSIIVFHLSTSFSCFVSSEDDYVCLYIEL